MRYFSKTDYPLFREWLKARGHGVPDLWQLPKVGFIDGVSCGFLIQTDTPIAMIDYLVSNPNASVIKRAKSIKGIINRLMGEAKSLNFKIIFANSKIRSVQRLAMSLRFEDLGNFKTFSRRI